METYLVKSFEEDFSTKTIVGKQKRTFQTLASIMATRTLRPNTKSFGQQRRLSTTILHKKYTKTYRPQGIIFRTAAKPSYVIPFDLVLLSQADKIVVHYYRIKNNLHLYYNHKLIEGYEKFIFKGIGPMLKQLSSPEQAWRKLNAFRAAHSFPRLPKSKYRLAQYNEAVFLKPIKIVPVALFGYHSKTAALAKRYKLRHFKSARAFYERTLPS